MAEALSPARKSRLKKDGWVLVPGLIPPARVAAAVREINNGLGRGLHGGRDAYADPKDYLSIYTASPPILDLAKGPLRDLGESLLGRGRVEPLSQGQIVLRFPSENDAVEYRRLIHLDGLYSPKDGLESGSGKPVRYSFNAGVFLSDVPSPGMGNLLVYPGSHLLIADAVRKRGVEVLKDGVEKAVDLPEPVEVTGKAGDVVLFHFQLAHDKGPNRSPHIRRTVYFRFWHLDAWHDSSREYLARAMADPWLEWDGMRNVK